MNAIVRASIEMAPAILDKHRLHHGMVPFCIQPYVCITAFTEVVSVASIFCFYFKIMLICAVAMNCARLKELRYYEPSVNDDETIRLRH